MNVRTDVQKTGGAVADEVICGKSDEDALDHCDVVVVDPERVRAVRALVLR